MIKAYFDFDLVNSEGSIQNIPLIMPISYVDRIDGLEDTMSFEFVYDDDLLPLFRKGKKCRVKLYDNNALIKDYKMCMSDISRSLNSTYTDNSSPKYKYTVSLCEPTILIENCIRTNITISPSEYKTNAYPTLYEAFIKVLSCHNMCNRNEKVNNNYFYLDGAMLNTPLSYSEILRELGEFYLNGSITFNEFTQSGTTFLEKKLELNNVKLPHTESVIFSTLPAGRPTIAFDATFYMEQESKTLQVKLDAIGDSDLPNRIDISEKLSLKSHTEDGIKLYNLLSSIRCPNLTYSDLSTFSQLSDIFDRAGAIPYLTFSNRGFSYLTFYLKQGFSDEPDTIYNMSTEEVALSSDAYSESINSQIQNLQCDSENIIYPSWCSDKIIFNRSKLDSGESVTIDLPSDFASFQVGYQYDTTYGESFSKKVNFLVPSSFDEKSSKVNAANTYNAILPTNIDYISAIYYVDDIVDTEEGSQIKIKKVSGYKFVEQAMHDVLPDLQKSLFAYYKRGKNTIEQIVSLLAKSSDLQGDWKWSDAKLYSILRKCRFFVEYKPMLDAEYTNYNYDSIFEKTTNTINLPYKLTSDKQASSILSYELESSKSSQISYSSVTTDISVLNRYSGEKVYYKDKILSEPLKVGEFSTYPELESYSGNINRNSWANVGNQEYIYNFSKRCWEKYFGKTCVITNINFLINSNTISVSAVLSDKISSVSAISQYSDNVRVSNNLSTENAVSRSINEYKTFLLNLTENDATFTSNNFASYNDFSNIDSFLPANGFRKIGFSCDLSTEILLNFGVKKFSTFGSFCSGSNLTFANYNAGEQWNKDLLTITDDRIISLALTKTAFGNSVRNLIFEKDVRPEFYYDDVGRIVGNNLLLVGREEMVVGLVPTGTRKYYTDRSIPSFSEIKKLLDKEIELDVKYIFRYNTDETWEPDEYFLEYKLTDADDDSYKKVKGSSVKIPKAVDNVTIIKNVLNPIRIFSNLKETVIQHTILADLYSIRSFTEQEIESLSGDQLLSRTEFLSINANPTLVSSNNILKSITNYGGTSSFGTYAQGADNDLKFYNVLPIYYKTSGDLSEFGGFIYSGNDVSGEYSETFSIRDNLLYSGFDDCKLDIREVPSASIQYIMLPNKTRDFLYKNDLYDYSLSSDGVEEQYYSSETGIYDIVELNFRNVEWLSPTYNSKINQSNNLIIKKAPKHLTLSNVSQQELSEYCQASTNIVKSSLYEQNKMFDFEITLTRPLEIDHDNNYVIFINNTPLMLVENNSVVRPTNNIKLTTFLV